MNTQFCLSADKLWLRGISGTSCITYYAAFLKYLQMAYLFFCLDVLNKTPLIKILYINGLFVTIHRHILTVTHSHPVQFYFLDYRCLYDLLQVSNIYIYIYIYIQSSHLHSICPRKANIWMDIIYQLLDRYLGPDPVWHWDCAFSRSIWPRDVVSCLVECTVPGCFPVSLNIPLSGASKTHLKIIILIISLNHWLLSLILLSLLLSLYFQIPSVWEVTFFRKLPSCFCATFTKFLPSAIFINPSADRIPSLCLSVLNKTPIIFQTNGLCTRHNRYSFHYHHFTS